MYTVFIALKYAISWGLTLYKGTRIRLCRFRQGEPGKKDQRVNSVMCTNVLQFPVTVARSKSRKPLEPGNQQSTPLSPNTKFNS